MLNLDVRETQEAAIRLYELLGYERWGVHPDYAFVRGQVVRGFFYCKRLRAERATGAERSVSGVSHRPPPPLAGGGWGEGACDRPSSPPPNPLPQGEGED